jgi:alpha-N-arabinofuranosidase
VTVAVRLEGLSPASAAGRVLTAPAMNSHNTFAATDVVRPVTFEGMTLAGGTLTLTLPAKSVVIVELK